VLIILIIVAVVGIIITILIPTITEQQSQQRFEIAQKNIQEIDFTVYEVLSQPIGTTLETSLLLEKQLLEINSDENKILISHTIRGNYFEEDRLQEIDSTKYNYREGRRLYSILEYQNINIYEDRDVENIKQLKIHVTKINKNTVDIKFNIQYME